MSFPVTVQSALDALKQGTQLLQTAKPWQLVAAGSALVFVTHYAKQTIFRSSAAPPLVKSFLPFFGSIAKFGENPVNFLLENYKKYGPVFSFMMLGNEVTYLIGTEASSAFWTSHNDDLNAEELYANLTVPVFGKGVAYDLPHKIFSEQKQMVKSGLTLARFETYTALMEQEAHEYLKRLGNEGTIDILQILSEMIIFTATRCLHGQEVRDRFDETVAQLYVDLDNGFTPLAWFLPNWIPFPSFRIRDRAHLELKRRFKEVIEYRKHTQVTGHGDMMETLMTARYQNVLDGRQVNEDETVGMLIALLMAGQHTSSTTSAWLCLYIAHDQALQQRLYEEQLAVLGKTSSHPVTLDDLNHMTKLHSTLRETLRMRPPIITLMRKCMKPFRVSASGKDYVIPVGAQVCVSPTVQQRIPDEWDQPTEFNAERFLSRDENGNEIVTQGEQYDKGGRFKWVAFGAGRHRCIGFDFAQIQIRAVMSVILREFVISFPSGAMFPEPNYATLINMPLASTLRYKRRIPSV
eukprot:m.169742 g.169742  ORF g.169742 m.169742 type:complete len:521 (+) comp53233_c0_seq2:95-1657(+)